MRRKQKRQAPVIELLEPRILLSADLPGLDTPDFDPDDSLTLDVDQVLARAYQAFQDAEPNVSGTSGEPVQDTQALAPETVDEPDTALTSNAVSEDVRRELIIVDPSVPNYELLLAGVNAVNGEGTRVDVVMIDPQRNGVDQITQLLLKHEDLDAIHLISHGSEGAIHLGSETIDLASLKQNEDFVRSWGDALGKQGDILIYGCDLAASEAGELFVDTLAQLTGADIAASDDLTGHESLGGDWELEFLAGQIESDVAVSETAQAGWTATLANEAPVANSDSYSVDEDQVLIVSAAPTPPTTVYSFDEGAGQIVSDTSGNGADGTLGDSSGAAANDPAWTTSARTGGSALQFDGADDFVQTTSTDLQTAMNFTLSAWFKANTTSGQQHIVWQGIGTENGWGDPGGSALTSSEMHLSVGHWSSADKISFFLGWDEADPNSIDIISSSTFTDTSEWHHASVVVTDIGGGNMQADLYVDGVFEGSDTGSQIDRSNWDTDLRISGSGDGTRMFNGTVDEVGVWTEALTPAQVNELWRSGVIANDSDVDGSALSASLVTGPSNGSLAFNADGSFEYTPNVDFNGIDTFSYKVNDGIVDSNTATVTITVNPVNDAATIGGVDAANLTEDTGAIDGYLTTAGILTASDVDNPDDTFTAASHRGSLGDLTIDGSGNWTYTVDNSLPGIQTLAAGSSVNDVITVSSIDGTTHDVTITITGNAASNAVDDAYTVDENGTLAVDWWDADWSRRSVITFDNSGQAETLTDVPVLVVLNGGNIDYALTQNDGSDLRFFDADGNTLAYDIEEWNESGDSYVWVKVPQITGGSNTDTITMYWGNASAASAENASAVWTNGYAAVNHLHDDFNDATVLRNTGTNSGSVDTDGQVGDGQLFDGLDDFVSLGDDASIQNIFDGGGTVSAWIYATGWGEGGYGRIFDKSGNMLPTNTGWALELYGGGQNALLFQHGFSGSMGQWYTGSNSISLNAWNHVSLTYDASDPSNVPEIYINGQLQTLNSTQPTGTAGSDVGYDLTVGNHAAATSRTFEGTIDNVQVSSTTRSADWIKAQYLATSGLFASVGAGEAFGSTAGVLDNDTVPDPHPPQATNLDTAGTIGLVTLNNDGTFTYDTNGQFDYLAAGVDATDTFSYTLDDGVNAPTVATVTITVTGTNDNPTTSGIADVTVTEDDPNTVVDLYAAFADVDDLDPALTYSITTNTNAALFNSTNIAGGNLTLDYAPDANGTADITVRATDTDGLWVESTFTVTVDAVNDEPGFSAPGNQSVGYESGAHTVVGFVSALPGGGVDEAGQTFSYTISNDNNALFSVQPVIDASGTLSYTVAAGQTGSATVTVSVTDSGGTGNGGDDTSPDQTFTITVGANTAPTVTAIGDQTIAEDGATAALAFTVGDAETAVGSLVVTAVSSDQSLVPEGSLSLVDGGSGNWTIQATPLANQYGTATITVTVDDGTTTTVGTFDVTVTSQDDPVIIGGNTSGTGNEDTVISGTLTATDTADGLTDGTFFTVTTDGANGTATIDPATGLWSYTPAADYNGNDSFIVTITDDDGHTATQLISITVTPVVDIVADSLTTIEDTAISANVLTGTNGASADNFEGAPVLTAVSQGANGTVTFLADGTVTYTPGTNFNGGDSFTYTITSGGVTETATVTVTVNPVTDLTAQDDSFSTNEDTVLNADVSTNDGTTSGGTLSYALATGAANGAVVVNADGTFSYTPASNFVGGDSFTCTVTDADSGESDTRTVTLTVDPVNDAPIFGGVDTGSVTEDIDPDFDNLIEIAGVLTISDADAGESNFQPGSDAGSFGQLLIDTAGNWSYGADTRQAAIQALDAGETITDLLTVTSADGTTHNVLISISGAEDASVISGIISGNVAEEATLIATGTLSISDVDASDNPVWFPDQATIPGDNGYGDFQLTAGSWSYTLNNGHAAVQALGAGGSLTDTYTFTASDGSTQMVSIVIAGAAEAVTPPVVEPPSPEPVPEPPPIELPPEPEDPGDPPVEEEPDPEEPPPTGRTDPIAGEPETVDPSGIGLNPTLPEPLEPGEIFLSVITDARPNDASGVQKTTTAAAKPDVQTGQTFLQELKSFWQAESTTASVEMSEVRFGQEFWNGLDKMVDDLDESVEEQDKKMQLSAEAAAGVGISLTAGFVSWALRAGSMAASFLASMPAWRQFDPMPVLMEDKGRKDKAVSDAEEGELPDEHGEDTNVDDLFER